MPLAAMFTTDLSMLFTFTGTSHKKNKQTNKNKEDKQINKRIQKQKKMWGAPKAVTSRYSRK